MWIYPTTFTEFNSWMDVGSKPVVRVSGTDEIGVRWSRATTNCIYATNNANLVLNAWQYICATIDQAGGAGQVVNVYKGTRDAAATECTYATAQDGSGAFSSNSGVTAFAGDNGGGEAAGCRIANLRVWPNVILTADQIVSHQWRMLPVVAGCKLWTEYGYNGTSTQPDWSGNGNAGTVTGATVGDHVPLGPPFGYDLGWEGAFTAAAAPSGRIWRLAGVGGGLVGPRGGLAA
jgi:hypothetical protein